MNACLSKIQTVLQQLNVNQSIGQLAVELPGATGVFGRLRMDFCCKGHLSLTEAAVAQGLDPDSVLGELATLQRPDTGPAAIVPAALIDHIIGRYHDVHRAQLPELIRTAHRVETVHREKPCVPVGLGAFVETLQQELAQHMPIEEAILTDHIHLENNVLFPQFEAPAKTPPQNAPPAAASATVAAHSDFSAAQPAGGCGGGSECGSQ